MLNCQFRELKYFIFSLITLLEFLRLIPSVNLPLVECKKNNIGFYNVRLFAEATVFAQSLSPETVADKFYQKFPDFPKENNYLDVDTGEEVENNTLVTRIVRYHQYIKARPTRFRLDWKLTLADYLGKNEIIIEDRYPGYSSLQKNPFKKDQEVIKNLTQSERQKLVDVLVSIYSPSSESLTNPEKSPQSTSSETEDKTEEITDDASDFILPQQGGAELLLP